MWWSTSLDEQQRQKPYCWWRLPKGSHWSNSCIPMQFWFSTLFTASLIWIMRSLRNFPSPLNYFSPSYLCMHVSSTTLCFFLTQSTPGNYLIFFSFAISRNFNSLSLFRVSFLQWFCFKIYFHLIFYHLINSFDNLWIQWFQFL